MPAVFRAAIPSGVTKFDAQASARKFALAVNDEGAHEPQFAAQSSWMTFTSLRRDSRASVSDASLVVGLESSLKAVVIELGI